MAARYQDYQAFVERLPGKRRLILEFSPTDTGKAMGVVDDFSQVLPIILGRLTGIDRE